MVIRSVKILLIPDRVQRQKFFDFAYYSDKIYNIALDWNKDYYAEEGMFLSRFDMINRLPDFKVNNPEFKQIDSFVLKSAVSDLRQAFNNFKTHNRFPRYKKYGQRNSFGVRNDRLKVYSNIVNVPSVGRVKCKHCHWLTRAASDEELLSLKYINPHINFDGKYWFLTFGLEVSTTPDTVSDEIMGIDLGIKSTAVLSNGVSKVNINHSRKVKILERRKKRLQRKLSRKYELNKQGAEYVKTRNIKKLHRRIRLIELRLKHIREDYIHKITNEIVRLYPKRIMIEDLKVKNMLKNRHLSKSIQEQCFYRIRQLLIEKAENTMAIEVGIIPFNYPSSKLCSRCGEVKKNLRLSDRVYVCDKCGLVIDRDLNAAINIRNCKEYKIVT